jgi:folate-dependent tRNA-U54 methylase TrmFO/GidA
MNANFGLLDDLETPVRDKRRKREMLAERALRDLNAWREQIAESTIDGARGGAGQ